MSQATTLLEVLERSGAEVRAYDVGRRVGRLPRELFLAFEEARQPYPLPMQRQAWIALVLLEDGAAGQPVIWFLRLDLDEQGLLVQAERDYLLGRLLESAHARQSGADPQAFLRDNPYAFKPAETRMALFHAQLSADLGRAPSRFYAHALDYFRGEPGWAQWEFVGYQGIADVACRHPGEPLDAAIPHLPTAPLLALCHCLENQAVAPPLQAALLARLRDTLVDPGSDVAVVAALVRGLAGRAATAAVRAAIIELLDTPLGRQIEILAAISGRAWEALAEPALLKTYLENLACNDNGQAAFEHCLDDLLSLPSLTGSVRSALRDDSQSDALRRAFARMTRG